MVEGKNVLIFDIEVFRHDWVVTFKNLTTNEYHTFHNDNYGIQRFMEDDSILLAGFNNKHYDNWILHALILGADNKMIKQLNDWIIAEGKNGWEFPFLRYKKRPFQALDLRDDLPMNLSLKAIEGNLGLPIVETSVSFNIKRSLSDSELSDTLEYCKTDVDNTERLYELRKDYIQSKITVGNLKGIKPELAVTLTNAKLASLYLEAKPTKRNDERDYHPPENVKIERIPKAILDFFKKMHDQEIPDKKLFNSKLNVVDEGVKIVYGFGGVHGAKANYQSGKQLILLWDVRGMYPNIMIVYDYLSRNVKNPKIFTDVVDLREVSKTNEDWEMSNGLKLVTNTAYGATLSKWNDLFDPLMGRSTCVTGQLFLSDLHFGLKEVVPSYEMLNINTDGLIFGIDVVDLPKAYELKKEWEERTQLGLDEEIVNNLIQKDVNNYIMESEGGKISVKGGWVSNYQDQPNIVNNSMRIVDVAIVDYFLYQKPPESTILSHDNMIDFQMITKTGWTYQDTIHVVGEENVVVQKTNRVYAVADKTYGSIYKRKENGRIDKIANAPEHLKIDNANELTIEEIDKQWYVELAKDRIKQFKGEI